MRWARQRAGGAGGRGGKAALGLPLACLGLVTRPHGCQTETQDCSGHDFIDGLPADVKTKALTPQDPRKEKPSSGDEPRSLGAASGCLVRRVIALLLPAGRAGHLSGGRAAGDTAQGQAVSGDPSPGPRGQHDRRSSRESPGLCPTFTHPHVGLPDGSGHGTSAWKAGATRRPDTEQTQPPRRAAPEGRQGHHPEEQPDYGCPEEERLKTDRTRRGDRPLGEPEAE